jgi:glycosyltransferase involved in cell wall biosynthesis
MTFTIVSHASICFRDGVIYTYAPYAREMNLWFRHVDKVLFVCPLETYDEQALLEPLHLNGPYEHLAIPDFNLLTWASSLRAIRAIPNCIAGIFRGMRRADHIHLRVPGNMGLLGCLVQVFFPAKPKTAKYAGNWDPKSRQPFSYRLQRWILSQPWLSKRTRVMVYGEWPGSSINLVPFFTATYPDSARIQLAPRKLEPPLQLMFVGALFAGKQPLLSIKVQQALSKIGISSRLHIFGNGPDFDLLQQYLADHSLENQVLLHGNQPASVVVEQFKKSHFLVFISQSEGWPKVVAESMFWGCVPLTTAVSCVPQMLDNGTRGSLVKPDVEEVVAAIRYWLDRPEAYAEASQKAMQWSQQYTLEKFEEAIARLLKDTQALARPVA